MTLRLRPHHLLCALTYAGEGYSQDFTKNFDSIIKRLSDGEPLELVEGPDDICAPLLDDPQAHCYKPSVDTRDQLALADLNKHFALDIAIGSRFVLPPQRIRQLQQAFKQDKVRQACIGCEWHELCTSIASNQFEQAQLSTA